MINYNFKDKQQNVKQLNNYMLTKTLSMFEYSDLPETIPYKELEKLLQINGYAYITEVKGSLYAFSGGLGGVSDVYGNPTTITINNVALNYNETLSIADDGVLITNDDMLIGLMPLLEKHNTLLVENDINMVVHGYNSRMQTLISVSDDRTKASAESYINKLVDGDIAVIGENALFDGVKVQAGSSGGVSVSTMLEYHQYIKGTLNNEVGLSSAFNMKKERLITSEVEQGEDSLFPYVYNMMKCRLKAIELINAKYGTYIEIDFGSVWHQKNKEMVDDLIDDPYMDSEQLTQIEDGINDLPDEMTAQNTAVNEPLETDGIQGSAESSAGVQSTIQTESDLNGEVLPQAVDVSEDQTEAIEINEIVDEVIESDSVDKDIPTVTQTIQKEDDKVDNSVVEDLTLRSDYVRIADIDKELSELYTELERDDLTESDNQTILELIQELKEKKR